MDITLKFSPSGDHWIVFFSGPSSATNAATPSLNGKIQVSWPELMTGFFGDFLNGLVELRLGGGLGLHVFHQTRDLVRH